MNYDRRQSYAGDDNSMMTDSQEQFNSFGAWMGAPSPTDSGVCNPQDIFVEQPIQLDELSDYDKIMQDDLNGMEYLNGQMPAPEVQQEIALDNYIGHQHTLLLQPPVQTGLNVNDGTTFTQNATRPQLHLTTTPTGLLPQNIHYPQALPRSAPAPAIWLQGPDAMQPAARVATPPVNYNPRRRAATDAQRPTPQLRHLATAPAATSLSPVSPDSLLSPLDRYVLDQAGERLAQLHIPSSPNSEDDSPRSGRPRSRSRSGSLSPSNSRSHSRNSSVASSGRSSVNGDHLCEHPGCGKRYQKRSALNHHQRCHTPYLQRKHVCDMCGKRFLYPRELDRHKLNISHKVPEFICAVCGKAFGRGDHLARHMNGHPRSRSVGGSTPLPAGSPNSGPSVTGSASSRGPHAMASNGSLNSGSAMTDWSSPPQHAKHQVTLEESPVFQVESDPFVDDPLPKWAQPFPSELRR